MAESIRSFIHSILFCSIATNNNDSKNHNFSMGMRACFSHDSIHFDDVSCVRAYVTSAPFSIKYGQFPLFSWQYVINECKSFDRKITNAENSDLEKISASASLHCSILRIKIVVSHVVSHASSISITKL